MTERRPITIIIDAEKRHASDPGTFEIPDRDDRMSLSVGDFAKIMFQNPADQTERMWVEIQGLGGVGKYRGRLDNEPVLEHPALRFGQTVVFGARDVIDIRRAPGPMVH